MMILHDHPDGTLTATDTTDCAAYIQYDNRLAAGIGDLVAEFNGVIIQVIKGGGNKPETVIAYAYGQCYKVVVEDGDTGVLCVPYYIGG